MAEIAKSGTPSVCTPLPPNNSQLGDHGLAGEDIAAGDACYIKNDGTVWRATGAAANAAARVRGFAYKASSAGEPVTIVHDVNMNYGAALAGGLADAASTGGTTPIAFAVDTTRVRVLPIK
jgi:hypothetical protein